MKITRIISTRLFTLFPNLIAKESYYWWVTRRKWGFRHQKSEAKYPKVSVANIWKHSGEFCRCTKMAAKFHRRTRWLRNHFAAKGWFRSAAKLAFNLLWSASNASNFFIAIPIRTAFEALACWLPELRNDIWNASNRLSKVLQKCQTVDIHLNSPCSFHPCILD